jgi:hypothetical protein
MIGYCCSSLVDNRVVTGNSNSIGNYEFAVNGVLDFIGIPSSQRICVSKACGR